MNHIPMPRESTNIASAGHEDGILEVKFKSGAVAQYQTDSGELTRLLNAHSHGKYHARNIKGKFPWRYKGETEWRAS